MKNTKIPKEIRSLDRTVGYLDILGFKEISKKYSSTTIGQTYQRAMKSAIMYCKKWCKEFNHIYSPCKIYGFSDSIAIFSRDGSENGFFSVVLHVKLIMQHLILHQFPIRGAIAFGDTFLANKPTIFNGNGYQMAVDLEKNQDWIGVSIDKSVEDRFVNIFAHDFIANNRLPNNKIIYYYSHPSIILYEVPIKNEKPELLFTINWLDDLTWFDNNHIKMPNIFLLEIIKENMMPDEVNIKRYNSTIEFSEYVSSIFQTAVDGSKQIVLSNIKYKRNNKIILGISLSSML